MSAYFTTGVQIALLDDRPQVSQVPHDGWAALSRRFSEWSARSAAEHETMTQTVEKAAQGARSAAASYVADDHNTAGTFAALSTSHNDPRGTAWA